MMPNTIKSLRSNENKLAMGFCQNGSSESEQGYKLGRSNEMTLSNIPVRYHAPAVAFMNFSHQAGRNLDSKQYKGTADILFHLIALIYAQCRKVLIFLDASDAPITLLSQSDVTLGNRIIILPKQYIIDDLDNDLAQAAITAKDNQAVISRELKRKKNYFPSQSTNFIYIIAPGSPYFLFRGGNIVSISAYLTIITITLLHNFIIRAATVLTSMVWAGLCRIMTAREKILCTSREGIWSPVPIVLAKFLMTNFLSTRQRTRLPRLLLMSLTAKISVTH
ncbi:hypothetical protein [Sodalis praecaptivus]|uniref:hypothetical protein n=1 Tax=Sodalis praecaptivus TaxID=1239307 RepID=UPI0011DDCF93|nr:hypothetical protein [Sodalis praecaptivus]